MSAEEPPPATVSHVKQQVPATDATSQQQPTTAEDSGPTDEPRLQLWTLVREVSARLEHIPKNSQLQPCADKLKRLMALNDRCQQYERQLKYVHALHSQIFTAHCDFAYFQVHIRCVTQGAKHLLRNVTANSRIWRTSRLGEGK